MNRIITLLSAAVDALIAAGIVLGIPLAAFSLLWLINDGMATDMSAYGSAASAIWLLANGVTITFSADLSGLVGVSDPVNLVFSLMPLLLTVVIVTLAFRSGRRIARLPALYPAWILVALVQVGITAIVNGWATAGGVVQVGPSAWIFPVLVYLVPLVIGSLSAATSGAAQPDESTSDLSSAVVPVERRYVQRILRAGAAWVDTIGAPAGSENTFSPRRGSAQTAVVSTFLSAAGEAAQLAAATIVATVCGTALVFTVAVVAHWADIVTLFESLHADILGVIVIAVAQLLYVPNAVLWTTAWLSGAGFAFGTGSAISPIGTQTGPLPALPILAAMPAGDLQWGYLGLAVPLLAAAVGVLLVGPRYARALASAPSPWAVWVVTSLGAVLAAAAALGIAAALSAGSLGVGRFLDVGPHGFAVFGALLALYTVVVLPATAVLLRRQRRDLRGVTPTYENPLAADE